MTPAPVGNRRGIQATLDDSIQGALAELANTQIEADEDDELSEDSADDADS